MVEKISGTKRIALGGVLTALAVVFLFLASILPTGRISLYVLSSFLISVIIIESGVKAGFVFFAATSLVSFLIIPSKIDILPYVFFFGCYGIVKYCIERLRSLPLEYLFKILFFAAASAAIYFTAKAFIGEIASKLPLVVIFACAAVIFIIYDYVYTLYTAYYNDKIRSLLKFR